MAKYLFIAIFLGGIMISKADCVNAYSSASYALSHAKKSLEAHNFDHQQYYAERALEAFVKTRQSVAKCGCDASMDAILNGIEHLNKALDPKDWEMGRYYTKKAVADAQALIASLDSCSAGSEVVEVPSSQETATPATEEESKSERKGPDELKAQLQLKRIAEITLVEFAQKCRELEELTGCVSVPTLMGKIGSRSEEELQNETLDDTRKFYMHQYMILQKGALQALRTCSAARD